jgi:hypothetical protein
VVTPLLEVLAGYFVKSDSVVQCQITPNKFKNLQNIRRYKSRAAYAWLRLLQMIGVDLEEYGHEEMSHHLENDVKRAFEYYSWRRLFGNQVRVIQCDRLVIFTYGSKFGDWEFWFVTQDDDSFVEFWSMIESPEYPVPGAWKEEFEDESDFGDE